MPLAGKSRVQRRSVGAFDGTAFICIGLRYEPMHLREGVFYPAFGMSDSFNQHSRGPWYINVPDEMRVATQAPKSRVGIDLGLKNLAVLCGGREIGRCSSIARARRNSLSGQRRHRSDP
jgi:transposase